MVLGQPPAAASVSGTLWALTQQGGGCQCWEGECEPHGEPAAPCPLIQQKSELGCWRVGVNGRGQVHEVWARSPADPTADELVLLKSIDLRLWVPLGASSLCYPTLLPWACVLLA